MVGDVYNTTVNIDGNRVFSSTYYPGSCCCGGMYAMNSCFGFGYGAYTPAFGIGYAAGVSLTPVLPNIFKGIGQAFAWLGTKVIAPAACFVWNSVLKPIGKFAWNNVLKPTGKAIGSAAAWVGKTVAKGASAVAKGVSNLWHNIFHKKSKTKEA